MGDMEGRMLPANGVLGEAAAGLHHLVKGGDAITGLELGDVCADRGHDAGDVVARVGGGVGPFRDFPGIC